MDGSGWFDPELIRALKFFGTIGFNIAGSMIAGFYVGRLLDQRAGTHPWFSLTGFLLGALSGFWGTYRFIMSEFDVEREKEKGRGKGTGEGKDRGRGQG